MAGLVKYSIRLAPDGTCYVVVSEDGLEEFLVEKTEDLEQFMEGKLEKVVLGKCEGDDFFPLMEE